MPRADADVEAALEVVRPICDDVRVRGIEAVRAYSERFDGVVQDDIRVPAAALAEALETLDPEVRARLSRSPCAGCARPAPPSSRPTAPPTWVRVRA